MSVGKDFYNILKEIAPNLASRLEYIRQRGLEDWVNLIKFELGSHSGLPHLHNVEVIANRIIPDHMKVGFSAGEIFLLLSAIYLHDIGKIIPNDPKKHFVSCLEIIEQQGIALGLPDERITKYCALLVFCHGLPEPPSGELNTSIKGNGNSREDLQKLAANFRTTSLAPYGILRIPLLASILRIADETDNSWNRALREYWYELYKENSENVDKAFRRCIEDIEFCHDGRCLILHVPEMEEEPKIRKEHFSRITDVRNQIDDVLHNWSYELNKIGVQFDAVFIEYRNHLYKESPFYSGKLDFPRLSEVVDKGVQKSVKQLLDSMIQLSLGSYGYTQFTWETLEAQVGRPLTAVDKWLVERIADASDHHILITEQNELRIEVPRKFVGELKSRF